MNSPAWLAWTTIIGAILIVVLLLAGRGKKRDDELEAAFRWRDRQERRARAVAVAAASDKSDTVDETTHEESLPATTATALSPDANANAGDITPDDLTRLKGIGPRLAADLKAAGVLHFAQIANWSADDIARIEGKLSAFPGRILRDDWVGQARLLVAGDEIAFEQVYGRDAAPDPRAGV